jgi:TetR/AcrR family transcriptional regulator
VRLFVETSYAGASLQQIADAAGYSKSSVLYHFASKEALLESALSPAVEKIELLLQDSVGRLSDASKRAAFVEEFIDFLLEYRLEAHIIINQGQSLAGIPTVERAREYISRLAVSFDSEIPSISQRIRLGVGLAGAAYVLSTAAVVGNLDESIDEVRAALIEVLSELVVPSRTAEHPVPAVPATPSEDAASAEPAAPSAQATPATPSLPASPNRLTA